MRIAVVIACHTEKRWDLLIKAIDSVCAQTAPAAEIFVVVDHNQGLFERLGAAAAQRYVDHPVVVLENTQLAGASGSRNTGAFAASAPLVAFLDDDASAGPDWLAHLAAPFADDTVVGTGGRVLPAWATHRPAWFPPEFDWVVGASFVGMPVRTEPIRNVWAENMAVRSEVFAAVHGFRTGFGKLGAQSRPEDTDVCIRMSAAVPGGTWIYSYDAVAMHHVPLERSTYGFFLRRCYHEGRGKAELSRLLSGAPAALSSERDYVSRTLPRGVLRHAGRALRRRQIGELGQSVNIVVGLAGTVYGYVVQKLADRFGSTDGGLIEASPGAVPAGRGSDGPGS